MSNVSAILITKNEEEALARCLESICWVDEIILVDSGSTDRTIEIAKKFGAKVYSENWKGYTDQKNSALQKVTSNWVISIDADEEFTEEAQNDIKRLIKMNEKGVDAYAFRRKVFYLGKWITHGDWYPDYVVRLWRHGSGKFQGGRVHESFVVEGKTKRLRSDILHYTYKDLDDQRARIEKYAGLWAQDQFDRGRKPSWIDGCFRPPLRFLRALIVKSGWLDGWRGVVIAWMCASEVALKYRNLRRLWRENSN